MEKMYNAVQRKIKNLTTQEPNPYFERKLKLHDKYLTQLDQVVQAYPAYKAELSNDYIQELSILNGITKEIGILEVEVKDKTKRFERSVDMGDMDIQKLKQVEANLQKFTSVEDLDLTSKKMLNDITTDYNRQKLLFWLKLGVIALIVMDTIHHKEYIRLGLLVVVTIGLTLLYSMYKWYTSPG
jgi:hypothetical protein